MGNLSSATTEFGSQPLQAFPEFVPTFSIGSYSPERILVGILDNL